MSTLHNCQTCCLSRRQCMKLLSASTLGAGVLGRSLGAMAQDKNQVAKTDFVDPAGLRPKPEVRVAAMFTELPRPYWLGWPGTTYDLDGHQKEFRTRLRQSAEKLGIQVDLAAKQVNDEASLTDWINKVKKQKPHGLLVMLQEIHTWSWIDRIVKEIGIPTIVFAPVGTAFTGNVARASRLPNVHVVSSLEWSAVEDGLRMIKAKRLFEETRILWIKKAERNETVMERLGVKVRTIPRDTFNTEFDKQPATDEVQDFASDIRRGAKKIVEPTPTDAINCGRAYVTAKRIMAAENANALSMDCLGMVREALVPTPPCGAWTVLMDQGITAGCEAALFPTLSLMLTSYLLERTGFMNDPVPETVKNLLIAAHCTSGTRLNGFDKPSVPYILRDHSESSLGVSMQVLWPEGQPCTLLLLNNNPNEMIIDTGTVVGNINTPPAGGCRTSVEIKMDNIEDCRDVKGFHQVVVLGNHKRILESFCELYGIKHTHSPQYSTFAQGAEA